MESLDVESSDVESTDVLSAVSPIWVMLSTTLLTT